MSRLLAKILLTVLIFPATILFYFLSFIVIEHWFISRDATALLISTILTCLFMGAYWLALWFRAVQWTGERIRWTLLAILPAAIFGGVIGVVVNFALNGEDSFPEMFGLLSATVVMLIATVFVWRESSSERAARLQRSSASAIVCPTCGYNLTGLSETRCPECGSKFTIDELLAMQPARAGAELEAT